MASLVPTSVVAALSGALSSLAFAHPVGTARPPADAWNAQPWLLALLATSVLLYAHGAVRLWKRAGAGRGITMAQASRFAIGWLVLVAALVSPLDALGERSFALHMIQHELLMVAAAPLLVCSRPLEAFTWALPPPWRRALARLAHRPALAWTWSLFTEPLGAWTVHAVALWAWHVPTFFDAALRDEGVHIAQHASFFVSALFFWWSVLARRSRALEGAAVASLVTTMLHTSALGALLTFAPSVWYTAYLGVGALGLAPIEDQQLGGLIMWVPAGAAYILTGLIIAAGWLREPAAGALRAPQGTAANDTSLRTVIPTEPGNNGA